VGNFKLNKKKIIVGIWIIVLIAIVFIAANGKNMLVGYTTYSQIKDTNFTVETYGEEISQLSTDVALLNQEVKNISSSLDATKLQLQKERMNSASLNKSLDTCESTRKEETAKLVKQYELQIGILSSKAEKASEEVESLKDDYDSVIENSARSICCKQKIDNPNIDYYSLDGDKIVCSEKKGSSLKCTFG
jgi:chromosome segregation ATPase